MTEIFDTYTHRPFIYKLMQGPAVLMIAALILILFDGDNFNLFEDIVVSICLFVGLAGFLVHSMWKNMPTYIKDGELLLQEDRVSLREDIFMLNDLKMIEINCYNYAGWSKRSRSDGSRNKIMITKMNGGIIKQKFVISSVKKSHNLGMIMKEWKQNGFKIISNGIDLI
ncbi:hypothetical protein [Mucilaginibacter sp. NFR10]|uniref:hypothetical protein n=1 Tax=Mucilaginibacter sp. NFR10 TaxID=1566292 RepID=UPI0008713BCB|nr:hypothetical protein [Mucilaginibacter sp. NFR10]SCW42046.1 hypothetical protein SAMN03159284_00520 [Mucilaginibacter sp. NFR10]